jgi:signal transduction histidine kinase
MVITNAVTFLSYLTISLTLWSLSRRTGKVIARDWAYFVIGFALFIVACGSTHLLEVVTTWVPVFWVAAWTNIVTAVLSAYVAIGLIVRLQQIAFGINDYADRLANVEIEKQQLQESLIAAQKIEEWSRLSAVVSHEIRGPLEAVEGLQYLIMNTQGVSQEIAGFARTSIDELRRALVISESTLSFLRHGKNRELIDIQAALDTVQLLVEPLIRLKEIDFRMEAEGDCIVEANAGEARQVLLNIVRNACEAVTRPRTKVTVTLRGGSEGVQVIVSDEGPGIEPAMLSNLFQFGVTTKGDQGNGMGLWTVKHILSRHGGDVEVRSTPGLGTSFMLRWPRGIADNNISRTQAFEA